MPGYETPIREGNALGIMCSYNSERVLRDGSSRDRERVTAQQLLLLLLLLPTRSKQPAALFLCSAVEYPISSGFVCLLHVGGLHQPGVNGKPTCANPELLKVLREDWGFEVRTCCTYYVSY